MYTILLVIHSIIVIFLIALVLVQKTDADGMSGLSGGGGNQFLTGRAQANLLTRTTAILAAAFFITSLVLAVMASHQSSSSILDTTATPTSQSVPLQNKSAPNVPEGGKSTAPATAAPQPKSAAPAQAPSVPKPE